MLEMRQWTMTESVNQGHSDGILCFDDGCLAIPTILFRLAVALLLASWRGYCPCHLIGQSTDKGRVQDGVGPLSFVEVEF